MMLLEVTPSSITNFLALGTEFLTWVIAGMSSLLTALMSNPVTACFLIAALIYIVIRITRSFVRV